MFKVGDLVEVKTRLKNDADNRQLVGLVESVVDGKIGVRWLITKFGYSAGSLSVFTNPLDFLRKVDKIEE